jgi:hypothetical protein
MPPEYHRIFGITQSIVLGLLNATGCPGYQTKTIDNPLDKGALPSGYQAIR